MMKKHTTSTVAVFTSGRLIFLGDKRILEVEDKSLAFGANYPVLRKT